MRRTNMEWELFEEDFRGWISARNFIAARIGHRLAAWDSWKSLGLRSRFFCWPIRGWNSGSSPNLLAMRRPGPKRSESALMKSAKTAFWSLGHPSYSSSSLQVSRFGNARIKSERWNHTTNQEVPQVIASGECDSVTERFEAIIIAARIRPPSPLILLAIPEPYHKVVSIQSYRRWVPLRKQRANCSAQDQL